MLDATCSRRYWKNHGVDGSAGAQSHNSSNASMSQSKGCADVKETGVVEDDHATNRIICIEDTNGEEEYTRSRQPHVVAHLGIPTKQELEAT